MKTFIEAKLQNTAAALVFFIVYLFLVEPTVVEIYTILCWWTGLSTLPKHPACLRLNA